MRVVFQALFGWSSSDLSASGKDVRSVGASPKA